MTTPQSIERETVFPSVRPWGAKIAAPLIIELHRELIVAAPEPVNTYLVDGKNYLSCDWLCEVAFLRVSGLDEFFAETFTMHQFEKDNLSSYIIEVIEKVIK